MGRIAALVTALVGAAAVSGAADAADMPGQYPPPSPRTVAANADGWYLRGDLGYRSHAIDGASAAAGFPAPGVNDLQSGFWFGGGAGFKTGALRVDATVDYGAPVNYSGNAVTAGDVTAKVQASTALFNVYYDIGTWSGLTPYIGAGVGAAYISVSDYQSAVTPPLTAVPEAKRWGVAWGAMAGVSYQLTRALAVDGGYRYLGLGSVETSADSFGKLTLKNLAAHEFRVGLRWTYETSVNTVP
jgi:opacity protein-like surface antigen